MAVMEPWFQEVYRAVSRGEPAFRTFAAEETVYLRSFHPRERLILLGGGHVAQPLCRYAADLGFVLVEEGKLPAGYGEGATQVWKKK